MEKDLPGGSPLAEALRFTLARSLFLGFVGAGVGLLGTRLLWLQSAYSMGIGLLFILLGLFNLAAHRLGWQLPTLDLGRWLRHRRGKSWAFGITFGLSAPACSTPLLLALLGKGAVGGVGSGFVSLSLFGLALSAPLLAILWWPAARERLQQAGRWLSARSYLVSLALVLIGIYTVRQGWRFPR